MAKLSKDGTLFDGDTSRNRSKIASGFFPISCYTRHGRCVPIEVSMKIRALRCIISMSLGILAFTHSRASQSEDRLIWTAHGKIQSITAELLIVNKFEYKLNSSTVYEKDHRQTTRSAFESGDQVKITFLTDRSVLELEGESSGEMPDPLSPTPTPDPTPEIRRRSTRLTPLGASKAKGESIGSYSSKESQFVVSVKIPRNSTPLATTIEEAKALSVQATITRKDTLIATCDIALDKKQSTRSLYQFQAQIQSKGNNSSSRVRSRKGRCVLASGLAGIPSVRSGDRVSISESSAGEFLEGEFKGSR